MSARPVLVGILLTFLVTCAAQAGDTTVAIKAVAEQSDPAKLATLKDERAANERLNKILGYLEEARRAGMIPSKTIDEAQKITGDTRLHAEAVKEMLLRNFEYAERASLFTDENVKLMKRGQSPFVMSGSYQGERYEADHIIPVKEFPQLGRELANLIYLPRTQNRQKSADITQRAIDLGQRLVTCGILTKADYERLKRMMGR